MYTPHTIATFADDRVWFPSANPTHSLAAILGGTPIRWSPEPPTPQKVDKGLGPWVFTRRFRNIEPPRRRPNPSDSARSPPARHVATDLTKGFQQEAMLPGEGLELWSEAEAEFE